MPPGHDGCHRSQTSSQPQSSPQSQAPTVGGVSVHPICTSIFSVPSAVALSCSLSSSDRSAYGTSVGFCFSSSFLSGP